MNTKDDIGLVALAIVFVIAAVVLYAVVAAIRAVFAAQMPAAAKGVSVSQAISSALTGNWQIAPGSAEAKAIANCIKSSHGTQADANAAIDTVNKLNANPPGPLQTAANYWFGTSYGVNLGTAGKGNGATPAQTVCENNCLADWYCAGN